MFHIDYVIIHGMRKELELFLLILFFIFLTKINSILFKKYKVLFQVYNIFFK